MPDLDIETLEILEEYLENFSGIIITVSHDRYFLDRIVDRIFAFDGNGNLNQYEVRFTDYFEKKQIEELEKASNEANIKSKVMEEQKTKYVNERVQKLKFSYMEQKEYEKFDNEIELIESEIIKIELDIIYASTEYEKLNEYMMSKEKKEKELEEKPERWVYLNDLADRIAAQQLF